MKMTSKTHLGYYKNAGLYRYLIIVLLIVIASVIFSLADKSWEHVSRCGGIITVFGVLLLGRDLTRRGPYHINEPKPPSAVPTGRRGITQFNINGVFADIAEKTDNYSKHIGIYIVVFGTLLWSYGDFVMQYLLPYNK